MSIFTMYFAIGQIIWGFLPIFWKSVSMLDPVYLLSARIVFSTFFCGLYLLFWDRHAAALHLKNGPLMRRLALASIFITANWGLYIMMVNTGHIFDASLAYFINPILCLLFSAFLFKEKMNRWQAASIAVAAAGIFIAFAVYGEVPWRALLLCFPFAIYSAIKKGMQVPGMFSVFAESLFMTLPSLLCMGWEEMNGLGASAHLAGWEWLLLPMTGILTAIPMAFFAAGLRGISFSAAAILMYGSPTIQLFLAPLFGETLSPVMLINFPFVFCAVLLFVIGNLAQAREFKKRMEEDVRH